MTCLKNDKLDLAQRGVDTVQTYMTIDADSPVGEEFIKLKNEITDAARKNNP
jgi:hypothetical protein